MAETTERPEREMVRRALAPGAAAVAIAAALGFPFGGTNAALSASLGCAVVVANFAAHGLSLSRASRISVTAVHVVALVGFVVRLGVIVALMFALKTTSWFSPLAFGLAVVPFTMLLLGYEARLVLKGLGGALQIPADPAAARAAERLAAREA